MFDMTSTWWISQWNGYIETVIGRFDVLIRVGRRGEENYHRVFMEASLDPKKGLPLLRFEFDSDKQKIREDAAPEEYEAAFAEAIAAIEDEIQSFVGEALADSQRLVELVKESEK